MVDKVFVFGSNLLGIHGAGSALEARIRGFPLGLGTGIHLPSMCYALPTKHTPERSLYLGEIKLYAQQLMELAEALGNVQFQVTRVGCGYAGFKDEQIAPLFIDAPPTCHFDNRWRPYLGFSHRYWGTF